MCSTIHIHCSLLRTFVSQGLKKSPHDDLNRKCYELYLYFRSKFHRINYISFLNSWQLQIFTDFFAGHIFFSVFDLQIEKLCKPKYHLFCLVGVLQTRALCVLELHAQHLIALKKKICLPAIKEVKINWLVIGSSLY